MRAGVCRGRALPRDDGCRRDERVLANAGGFAVRWVGRTEVRRRGAHSISGAGAGVGRHEVLDEPPRGESDRGVCSGEVRGRGRAETRATRSTKNLGAMGCLRGAHRRTDGRAKIAKHGWTRMHTDQSAVGEGELSDERRDQVRS